MITQPLALYEKLSQKYNLPVDTIREIIIFFYREGVKRAMENMENPEIYIDKLGSFKIKEYKLKYVIPESLHKAENRSYELIKNYYYDMHEKLLKIQKMVEQIKEEKLKFNEINKTNSRDISQ